MVGVFEVALTKSTGRKEKDMQRKLKSGILELGDKVLVRETEVVLGAEVIQRHENELTYTIKTTRNMLMLVNHILKTADDAPNICLINIKLYKKFK